jgi:site-specific DNA recombinase
LQGRFAVRVAAAVEILVGSPSGTPKDGADAGEEIVIDFREAPQYEAESERAKELFDKGWLMIRIAKEMGKKKSYVRKLVVYWFDSRGLPVPDGRSRRSTLGQKHQLPPMFEALADPVQAFLQEGLLIGEIAERLGCCHETITKVIDYLRTTGGLSIPDGRTRRKGLAHKVSHPRRGRPDAAGGDSAA